MNDEINEKELAEKEADLKAQFEAEEKVRAAAPELLEALINILKVCKSPTLTTHGLVWVDKAEAIIKKVNE